MKHGMRNGKQKVALKIATRWGCETLFSVAFFLVLYGLCSRCKNQQASASRELKFQPHRVVPNCDNAPAVRARFHLKMGARFAQCRPPARARLLPRNKSVGETQRSENFDVKLRNRPHRATMTHFDRLHSFGAHDATGAALFRTNDFWNCQSCGNRACFWGSRKDKTQMFMRKSTRGN